jgi:polyhydroxyalkanoate synthesis regulator phasin
MQELIDRLVKEAGVTPEQAKQSIETIAAAVNQIFKHK